MSVARTRTMKLTEAGMKKQLLFFCSHKTSGIKFFKVETLKRKIQKIIDPKYKPFLHVEYYLRDTCRRFGENPGTHKIF
jgi:hypothetical protein